MPLSFWIGCYLHSSSYVMAGVVIGPTWSLIVLASLLSSSASVSLSSLTKSLALLLKLLSTQQTKHIVTCLVGISFEIHWITRWRRWRRRNGWSCQWWRVPNQVESGQCWLSFMATTECLCYTHTVLDACLRVILPICSSQVGCWCSLNTNTTSLYLTLSLFIQAKCCLSRVLTVWVSGVWRSGVKWTQLMNTWVDESVLWLGATRRWSIRDFA